MPYCADCTLDAEFVRRCEGDLCLAGVCPMCEQPDALCSDCRREQARGIWQRPTCPPAADVVAYLGGATVAGERLPALCGWSGEPADQCDHLLATEESDHA